MPLLILDRDGVINEDSEDYIRCLSDWRPIPGSLDAIARLCRAGFEIAIATNQSGLGRGYFDRDQLEAIHQQLRREVTARGGQVAGIFYCPHLPEDGCDCRKPATGLLSAIEAELATSAHGCPFVGDSLRDLEAARAFGCDPILVRTGKGEQTLRQLRSGEADLPGAESIPVYPDLAAAVPSLLASYARKGDG